MREETKMELDISPCGVGSGVRAHFRRYNLSSSSILYLEMPETSSDRSWPSIRHGDGDESRQAITSTDV
jgi:hypothetical protein